MENKKKQVVVNITNIFAYSQGHIRYWLYYSSLRFIIPLYIREQIEYRINSMRRTCYQQGQCELCGCKTTHLQMANKTCEGNCYPIMLNRKDWKWAKKHSCFPNIVNMKTWKLDQKNKKFYQ